MKILIVNVHSALNLGDSAIMYETLRGLARAYPGAMITVAANDPGSWRKHDGVQVVGSLMTWVVDRKNNNWRLRKLLMLLYAGLLVLAAVLYRVCHFKLFFGHSEQRILLRAYYDADLVLSCGGGNFYAHRLLSPSFIWSLFILAFAHFLGKKTALLPQSIGPIEGRFQRLLARFLFDRVDRILVREHRSRAFLEELKVSRPANVLPDLAFGLPSISRDSILPPLKSDKLRIGVTVIDRAAQDKSFNHQQTYEDALVSVLIRLNRDCGAHIYLFSQCYGPTQDQDDRYITSRIYDRVRQRVADVTLLEPFQDALQVKAACRHMSCVIGSRMHTGVFALSSIVPVVLIGYQPKACGVMEMFGLERFCCNIETVTEDELYRLVREALNDREEIRLHISQRLMQIQESLKDWVCYLPD